MSIVVADMVHHESWSMRGCSVHLLTPYRIAGGNVHAPPHAAHPVDMRRSSHQTSDAQITIFILFIRLTD